MSTAGPGLNQFLQIWIGEFAKAVAEVNGLELLLSCSRAHSLPSPEMDGLLWCRQSIGSGRGASSPRLTAWVGSRQATWETLATSNSGDPSSSWSDLLNRVLVRALDNVNATLPHPLSMVGSEITETVPDFQSLCYALIGIKAGIAELPSLTYVIEPAAQALFAPLSLSPASSAMLQRLMGLELPLSVALGRATMPIRDVLKITSGSVVKLDGHTGDQVELLVHGTLVARGEVVSVKGYYGVKIKEIMSALDRISLYAEDGRLS